MRNSLTKIAFTAAITLTFFGCGGDGGDDNQSSSSNTASNNFCYYTSTQQCFDVGSNTTCPGGGEHMNSCPVVEQSSSGIEDGYSSSEVEISSSGSEVDDSSSSSEVESSSSGLELAECGDGGYYNPATHFCVGNTFYRKCGGEEYDVNNNMCDTRDNKIYQFAKIGNQTWMMENLNYSANYTIGYCYGADIFGAEHTNLETCDNGNGRVYRWAEVTVVNPFPQGLCPDGWHVPSSAEWQTVKSATPPASFYIYSGNYNSNPEWTLGWNDINSVGFYWTSSAVNYVVVFAKAGTQFKINDDASSADIFSIRCIKD